MDDALLTEGWVGASTDAQTSKEDLKEGLRNRVRDDDFDHFEYAGGAEGAAASYFMTRYAGVNAQTPPNDNACACGHYIERLFYIEHMPSRKPDGRPVLVQIGCDCINYFRGRVRHCGECGAPHRNRADNYCAPCREVRRELAKSEGPRRMAKRRDIAAQWVGFMRRHGAVFDFELPAMEDMTLAQLRKLQMRMTIYGLSMLRVPDSPPTAPPPRPGT